MLYTFVEKKQRSNANKKQRVSNDMVLSSKGTHVDSVRSTAALKRVELGRVPKMIRQWKLRVEMGTLLPQVLLALANLAYPHISIVNIFVKLMEVSVPSQRNPDKTMLRLTQVADGTKGSRRLPCFMMTQLSSIIKQLETKPEGESNALFRFESKVESKVSTFLHRLQNDAKMQMVYGKETDDSGRNIGWHNSNKVEYSDENVYLLGHPFLDVNDPSKVALMRHNKKVNPVWSVEDLPRP